MIFLFALLQIFLSAPAKADILFLDLNFAPAEIVAAKNAASARGEKLFVFPERTLEQQNEIDSLYREAQRVAAKYVECTRKLGDCTELEKVFKISQDKVQAAAAKLIRIDPAELERILARLKESRVNLSSVVFSGHSGGTGYFGGLLGTLGMEAITAAMKAVPGVLENVQSILLWGCYSGTLYSLNDVWHKNFPNTKIFVGYQNRAPLGIRESSGIFLKSFLLNEARLLQARSMQDSHRIFRGLDLVADLDGTAMIGDYFFTYDQAESVSEMLKRCATFDPALLTKFDCYENGQAGCENPPLDHLGPLRALYSFLQVNRHCVNSLKEKFPTLPSPDYIVRLIFLDNIKRNFDAHHRNEFSIFSHIVSEAGLSHEMRLEKFVGSSRADDVKNFLEADKEFNEQGFRDYSVLDNPLWRELNWASSALIGVRSIIGPSWFRETNYSCVPFSWVEPGAAEPDECRLSGVLKTPINETMRQEFLAIYFDLNIYRFKYESSMPPYFYPVNVLKNQKANYLAALNVVIKDLSERSYRSNHEEKWLLAFTEQLTLLEKYDDRQVVDLLIAKLETELVFIEQSIVKAKSMEHSQYALQILENRKTSCNSVITMLKKLIEN